MPHPRSGSNTCLNFVYDRGCCTRCVNQHTLLPVLLRTTKYLPFRNNIFVVMPLHFACFCTQLYDVSALSRQRNRRWKASRFSKIGCVRVQHNSWACRLLRQDRLRSFVAKPAFTPRGLDVCKTCSERTPVFGPLMSSVSKPTSL